MVKASRFQKSSFKVSRLTSDLLGRKPVFWDLNGTVEAVPFHPAHFPVRAPAALSDLRLTLTTASTWPRIWLLPSFHLRRSWLPGLRGPTACSCRAARLAARRLCRVR